MQIIKIEGLLIKAFNVAYNDFLLTHLDGDSDGLKNFEVLLDELPEYYSIVFLAKCLPNERYLRGIGALGPDIEYAICKRDFSIRDKHFGR